ncbi:MAG: type II toxin-antitoxin system RelE/ParE family toxin [Candidatus Gracilibacteria bacterium]|nr:type II toxin-antitoxin system RelE/ParE family toxin [Candidatus Gracilibacteria bacterium]MDD5179495.1 type II toxin-antitoxin system RelE/ParE family toxin [Candidatus Gracilibacteria bacterium]
MQEYKLSLRESAKQDLEAIEASILAFSDSEAEARYVLKLILKGIQDLKNPYFLGLIPYSTRIAEAGFYFYPIVGGSYVIYFQVDKLKKEKAIFYIKPSKTNYESFIC